MNILKNQQGANKNQERGWKIVNRKQTRNFNGRWDIMTNGKGSVRGPSTTFYFSNFEEEWSAKDLFYKFKDLWVIEEIVIPTKKDWRGNKYGFVSFVNVS